MSVPMLNLTDDYKASAAAYAARPYAVRVRTSHFSGEFRFETLSDALEDIQGRYASAKAEVKQHRYRSFCARETVLILPGNIEIQAREFIGDSLSSY